MKSLTYIAMGKYYQGLKSSMKVSLLSNWHFQVYIHEVPVIGVEQYVLIQKMHVWYTV